MPRIRCLYLDCTFLDANYCTAPTVEFDPDLGCATYLPVGDENVLDDDWEDEDEEFETWETEDLDDDEDGEDFSEEDDW